MKKKSIISKSALLGTMVLSATAHASLNQGNLQSRPSIKEWEMTREDLLALGIRVDRVISKNGQVRPLYENELVKVRIHDEKGIIDFSSFDDYSYDVAGGPSSKNPRNIV